MLFDFAFESISYGKPEYNPAGVIIFHNNTLENIFIDFLTSFFNDVFIQYRRNYLKQLRTYIKTATTLSTKYDGIILSVSSVMSSSYEKVDDVILNLRAK